MNKKFFPGANTGVGFVSRFGGICPPWEPPHYTYVLKGGPGVGKNTLMKSVAQKAEQAGYTVEEFRCASDPESFDAVRIREKRIVLLDGTAPHSIDPVLPGMADEIIDLGHFKNREEFSGRRDEVAALFSENSAHYALAYACLGAARKLKCAAAEAVRGSADMTKIGLFVRDLFFGIEDGVPRELFASSATPLGVTDFSDTLGNLRRVPVPRALGTLIMREAYEIAKHKKCEIFLDFIMPDIPQYICFGDMLLTIGDESENTEQSLLCKELPSYAEFSEREAEVLTARAVEELHDCLALHDFIEEIYRPYVDYARVDSLTAELFERLAL